MDLSSLKEALLMQLAYLLKEATTTIHLNWELLTEFGLAI